MPAWTAVSPLSDTAATVMADEVDALRQRLKAFEGAKPAVQTDLAPGAALDVDQSV